MSDPIDELAAAGKTKRAEAERAAAALVAAMSAREAGEGRRATSRIGWLAAPAWFYVVGSIGGVGLLFFLMGVAQPQLHYSIRTDDTYTNPSLYTGGIAIAIAVAWTIAMAIAARFVAGAVHRETEWARALPFAIYGHMTVTGKIRGRVTIEFRGASPDRALIAQLFDGVSAVDGMVRIDDHDDRSNEAELSVNARMMLTERCMWRLVHRVVDTMLVPLHARFPIVAVRFC